VPLPVKQLVSNQKEFNYPTSFLRGIHKSFQKRPFLISRERPFLWQKLKLEISQLLPLNVVKQFIVDGQL
jgi:hypothetical protein